MSLEGPERGLGEATLAPVHNASSGAEGEDGGERRGEEQPFPWAVTLLAGVLITTIVVDIIGNLLVIVSVFRNRKLRKAGE